MYLKYWLFDYVINRELSDEKTEYGLEINIENHKLIHF